MNELQLILSTKEITSFFCTTFEIPSFYHFRLFSTQLNQSESLKTPLNLFPKLKMGMSQRNGSSFISCLYASKNKGDPQITS